MEIRFVTERDMPLWMALSAEYDGYVSAAGADLSRWYAGEEGSPAFMGYMRAKIAQREAVMAAGGGDGCLGVVAFSRRNNRITFFAVSHGADFFGVAGALLDFALDALDQARDIYINEIVGAAQWLGLHRRLYRARGFVFYCDAMENGVPVRTLVRLPDIT